VDVSNLPVYFGLAFVLGGDLAVADPDLCGLFVETLLFIGLFKGAFLNHLLVGHCRLVSKYN